MQPKGGERPRLKKAIIFAVLAILAASAIFILAWNTPGAKAATTTCNWTNNAGAGDNKWSTATNWDCGAVPSSTKDVVLNGTANYALTIDSSATAGSFTVNAGYSQTITATANLALSTASGGTANFTMAGGIYSAGSTIITVPGSWDTSGGTFTKGTSNVTFTANVAGKTIKSGANDYNILTFNGTTPGTWTLQDALTAGSLSISSTGKLIDNAQTVTVNGNISIANTSNELQSTGSWVQGASGNISNPSATNKFKSLTVAGNGVTTTLTGDVVAGTGTVTLGPGTINGGNHIFTAQESSSAGGSLTINNVLIGTSFAAFSVDSSGYNTTQKEMIFPNNFATLINVWANNSNLTASGNWNFANNDVQISTKTTTNPPVKYIDMASYSLTTSGNLYIGNNGSSYNGYLKLGSNQSHSVGSIKMQTNAGAGNILDMGSGKITASGDVDLTGLSITAGTGTLIMSGNGKNFTPNGQTLKNFEAAESPILAGDLTLSGNLKIDSGKSFDISNRTVNVAGNFNNAGGTLTSTGSSVNLTGADGSNQLIQGSTSFNNLSATTSANTTGRTLTFDGSSTQTISGTWTATGAAGKILTLQSGNGSNWSVNPTAASAGFLNVSHSTNTGSYFCSPSSTYDNPNTNIGWHLTSKAACDTPNAPTGFTGNVVSTSEIDWSWTDNSGDEDKFQVQDAANASRSGDLSINATTWNETQLTPNTGYTRHAAAINTYGASNSAPDLTKYTLAINPGDPTLSAQDWNATDGVSVDITIHANGNANGTEYEIYYDNVIDGPFVTTVQTFTPHNNGDIVSHTQLTPNRTYYYKMKARNGEGVVTAETNIVSVKTKPDSTHFVNWQDTDWRYRKQITVDNSANPSTLTNYQISVDTGVATANSQADNDDVKFTYINPATGDEENISYWLEDSGERPKYEGTAKYYDNRKASVVFSLDEWKSDQFSQAFADLADILAARHIWFSPSILTNSGGPPPWALIQSKIDNGYLEPCSHTRTHPNVPYPDPTSEIIGSHTDIENNLTFAYANGNTDYTLCFIEPYGATDATNRQKVGEAKYLAERDVSGYGLKNDFTDWDETNGKYYIQSPSAWIGNTGQGLTDAAALNAIFDQIYNAGGIYHLWGDMGVNGVGQVLDLSPGSYALQHFDHIGNRKDVWYTGFGHQYLYHYTATKGVVTEQTSGSGTDKYFKISATNQAHTDYGLAYPVTYVFDIPEGSSGLSAQKKYNLADSWQGISEKTSNDLFNGIEAVRFDYPNNKAYVSVAFPASSVGNDIYLRFVNINPDHRIKAWAKVPTIAANGQAVVYMYYGNQAAVTDSSFDNTFTKTVNTQDLVLNLRMDDGSGPTANDSSTYNNNASLISGDLWYSTYHYRQKLAILNNSPDTAMPVGTSLVFTLDTASLIADGKMLANGNDLRILYYKDGVGLTNLDRTLTNFNTDHTTVTFQTNTETIAAQATSNDYQLFYGKSDATAPGTNVDPNQIFNPAPTLTFQSEDNYYATWVASDGGQWRDRSDIKFSTGSHLSMDGRSDYLNILDKDELDWSGALTISSWIKINSGAGGYLFAKNYGTGSYNLKLTGPLTTGLPTKNKIRFKTTLGGTSYELQSAMPLSYNEWHFIAFTFDGSSMKFYIDGKLDSNQEFAHQLLTNTSALAIGSFLGSANEAFFGGEMDDARVYKRVLSTGELTAQYERRLYSALPPAILVLAEEDNQAPPSSSGGSKLPPVPPEERPGEPTENIVETVYYYSNHPLASFSLMNNPSEEMTYIFDASQSFSTTDIVKFEWSFGDGTTSDQMRVEHHYNMPGRYMVTLKITDRNGRISTTKQTVDIIPPVPTIENIKVDGNDLLIIGKTSPSTTVQLIIHSDPIEDSTESDQQGDWIYRITNAKQVLNVGDHTVIATSSFVLSGNNELKSDPSKTYDFKVSFDGDKLKVEMRRTRLWQMVSLGLGLIIIAGVVIFIRKRKIVYR